MTVRLEGFHAVKHALRFAPALVDTVEVEDLDAVMALAARLAPDVVEPLRRRAVPADVDHPTGVQAQARRPGEDRTVLERRAAPLLVLERPRHAGNAGAAVRVAAAAGASGVVTTGDLDPWHPAVLRGSAGLHYALPVLRADPADVVGPLMVLDAGGAPLTHLPDDAVLVVGSERSGVGAELRERADAVVALPMRAGVSSLNLATAAAAALYAWRLRR
ncbi:MAG: TrmH family RNA methyltransferase [Actinomycetes bacterium]